MKIHNVSFSFPKRIPNVVYIYLIPLFYLYFILYLSITCVFFSNKIIKYFYVIKMASSLTQLGLPEKTSHRACGLNISKFSLLWRVWKVQNRGVS